MGIRKMRTRSSSQKMIRRRPAKYPSFMKLHGTRSTLRKLECPICYHYPRQAPIYTCEHGHILCTTCQQEIRNTHECELGRAKCLGICPLCRSHKIGICPTVQELGQNLLTTVKVKCRFSERGCNTTDTLTRLGVHEPKCSYRVVPCFAGYRNSCNWEGNLRDLGLHVRDKGCIQVLRSNEGEEEFRSSIGDFSDKTMTVFNRTATTHWRPVLLMSERHIGKMIYLTVQRYSTGHWVIAARSLSSDSRIGKLRVQIDLHQAENLKDHRLTYTGEINSYQMTNQEIFNGGKMLLLSDSQLSLLCTENSIFHYVVKILDR